MDALHKNYLFKNAENSSQDTKSHLPVWHLVWWSTAIRQQCVPSSMTLAFFIDGNIQHYWYLESPVIWSYFKYREVPNNLRRGPVLFTPPARSTIDGTNSVHFRGSLNWNNYLIWLNLAGHYLNLRIWSRKSETWTVGVWYVEASTLAANFHVSLVLLCVLWDHVGISHLNLYCRQLTGCYMISKNAENVEHLVYWLRVCHFLCHFLCHFFFSLCDYFVIFVSCFLLAIS